MTRMQVSVPDHPALALLPEVPTRSDLEAFGHFVQECEARSEHPHQVCTMRHAGDSIEGRSVVIPAETFLVGLPHKLSGIAVCIGDITVWTEHGRQRYTGAHIIETQPGSFRVGFAHSDTTWLTVHANKTGSTDQAVVEDSLVEHAERLMTRRKLPELEAA